MTKATKNSLFGSKDDKRAQAQKLRREEQLAAIANAKKAAEKVDKQASPALEETKQQADSMTDQSPTEENGIFTAAEDGIEATDFAVQGQAASSMTPLASAQAQDRRKAERKKKQRQNKKEKVLEVLR